MSKSKNYWNNQIYYSLIYFWAKTTRYTKQFLVAFEHIYDAAVVDKMITEWLKNPLEGGELCLGSFD